MKHIPMIMLGLLLFSLTACTDEELDPIQIAKLKKASILTLRGSAYTNLVTYPLVFRGAVDTFNVNLPTAGESFEFSADFQSEDPNSLSQVDVYARGTETGPRVRVATVASSAFSVPSGGKYPQAAISIALDEILSKTNTSIGSITPGQYLYVECDVTLTDGSIVPASAIVNGSLFESQIFYPAHNLLYLAKN